MSARRTQPRTPEDERKGFHLPPGFDIELVAAEPDVRKPINMNFDAHGRLWVTESTEYPFAVSDDRKGKDHTAAADKRTHRRIAGCHGRSSCRCEDRRE